MEDVIDPCFENMVLAVEDRDGETDFAAIARDADTCAKYFALGYGIHNQTDFAEYATWSRDAEEWMQQIAEFARSGQTIKLKHLIVDGQTRHCDRCHDATG